MTEILYNGKDVSRDYYMHTGEYWDIIQRVLRRADNKELAVLSNSFGEGLVLDQRFRIMLEQPSGGEPGYIRDVPDRENQTLRFEIGLQDDRFSHGRFSFRIFPSRVEITSDGDDDREAAICLLCGKDEFVISLVPEGSPAMKQEIRRDFQKKLDNFYKRRMSRYHEVAAMHPDSPDDLEMHWGKVREETFDPEEDRLLEEIREAGLETRYNADTGRNEII